jgi:hypothetical protein
LKPALLHRASKSFFIPYKAYYRAGYSRYSWAYLGARIKVTPLSADIRYIQSPIIDKAKYPFLPGLYPLLAPT